MNQFFTYRSDIFNSHEDKSLEQIELIFMDNNIDFSIVAEILDTYPNKKRSDYKYLGSHTSEHDSVKCEVTADLLSKKKAISLGTSFDSFCKVLKIKEVAKQDVSIISNTILDPNYDHVGFQRHLIDGQSFIKFDTTQLYSLSLGKLINQKHLLEPVLRQKKYLYLDTSVLKCREAGSGKMSLPTGLSTEQLAQLGTVIGSTTDLQYICISSWNTLDTNSAHTLATFLWYLLEARLYNNHETPKDDDQFEHTYVEALDIETNIHFVRSTMTDRWWVAKEEHYFPTTHEEYNETLKGNTPQRISRIYET